MPLSDTGIICQLAAIFHNCLCARADFNPSLEAVRMVQQYLEPANQNMNCLRLLSIARHALSDDKTEQDLKDATRY